jgi:putative transposase
VLLSVKNLIDKRPSYGYRRVTAMLKRERNNLGLEAFNHKRIYRIMRANNLLLQRFTGKSTKTHDGKVVSLASNMRWSADTFSIKCFNGEKLEVSFCIDTCDREIISYVATPSATNGELIRDLIAQSCESRFQKLERLPKAIE